MFYNAFQLPETYVIKAKCVPDILDGRLTSVPGLGADGYALEIALV
jgi:hypothetical protein